MLDHLFAKPFFSDQFEHGLEGVDIEAQIGVDGLQERPFSFRLQTIIANHVADHGPVLLLDVGLIILAIGRQARESDVLNLAVVEKQLINEFGAIVQSRSLTKGRASGSAVPE